MEQLLTRKEFNNQVLKRDNYKCVICGEMAVDVHHIVERKLFHDMGFYISNGVSLCSDCHLQAEMTVISCEELREKAGIHNVIIPEHLESPIDKWGNYILNGGTRLRGELFYSEQVQKMLNQANLLSLFDFKVKYPRTRHFEFSRTKDNDDVMIRDLSCLENEEVIASEKMDGEGTSNYRTAIHARSLAPMIGEDRAWMKKFHSGFCWNIPEGWRICGENMYAKHSIHYTHLETYFYVYSIWNENNICLSWNETLEWCELLGLTPVRQIYRGSFNIEAITKSYEAYKACAKDEVEGYVLRATKSFPYSDFGKLVGKMVRKGHVKTTNFWRHEVLTPNLLENKNET